MSLVRYKNKIYDTKIEMSKVESSIKELKDLIDTLHNEILLLEEQR